MSFWITILASGSNRAIYTFTKQLETTQPAWQFQSQCSTARQLRINLLGLKRMRTEETKKAGYHVQANTELELMKRADAFRLSRHEALARYKCNADRYNFVFTEYSGRSYLCNMKVLGPWTLIASLDLTSHRISTMKCSSWVFDYAPTRRVWTSYEKAARSCESHPKIFTFHSYKWRVRKKKGELILLFEILAHGPFEGPSSPHS